MRNRIKSWKRLGTSFALGALLLGGLVPGSAPPGNRLDGAVASDPRNGWRPESERGMLDRLREHLRQMFGGGAESTTIAGAEHAVPRHDPVPPARPMPAAKRVREFTAQRSAHGKVYQLSDGRLQQEVSAVPAHYRARDGSWQDIDTTVRSSDRSGYPYANQSNGLRSFFGSVAEGLVRVEVDGASLTWSVSGVTPTAPVVNGSRVTYPQILGAGTDLRYDVEPGMVRKSIVLPAPPRGDAVYGFDVRLEGLRARQLADGSIGFYRSDLDPQPVLVIPKPFAVEEGGNPVSDKVTQSISGEGSNLRITLRADKSWLADPKRRYPVVIDPTVRIIPDPGLSQDTMILSSAPDTNLDSSWSLDVGTTGDASAWVARSLLKFPLPGILPNTYIDSAQLELWYDRTHTSNAYPVTLEAHRATADWQEGIATWRNASNNVGELGNNTEQVDDGDFFKTTAAGAWPVTSSTLAINGDFVSNSGSTTGDSYTWFPCLSEAGTYRVEAHFVAASDRATNAPYTVHHKGGTATVAVNQSATTAQGKWASLGAYAFDAGCGVQKVVLGDIAGKVVVADSVRLIKDGKVVKGQDEPASKWHSFSVRNIVQSWLNGSPNYGFVLKAADEATKGRGGPRYEASADGYNGETANRPRLVVTYGRPGVGVNQPTTVHATGAELSWPAYVDPCGWCGPDDDIAEYQVHRSFNQTFTPSLATLVAPLPPAALSYVDTTATPTPADSADAYGNAVYYMVAVKTKDGKVTPGTTVLAKLPKAGRVSKIFQSGVTDANLYSAQPDTNQNSQTLTLINFYGVSRSVMKFPVSGIPSSAQVVDAQVRLWNTDVWESSAATWEMRPLTRAFDQATATWNRANATTPWTTPGGDFGAVAASSPSGSGQQPKLRDFSIKTLAQQWVNGTAANNGLMLKIANESTPWNAGFFLSAEGSEPLLRPRLLVTYLENNAQSAYYVPATPPSVLTDSTSTLDVTLTNTTLAQWRTADWDLSYRWTRPDGTVVTASQLLTPLPTDMQPGDTYTVQAQVKAPPPDDAGNHRGEYVLEWDLRNKNNGSWLSGAPTNSVGALKQSLAVERSTSDQVGLEKFYAYGGKNTGSGSALLNNLHAGNAVWQYNALSNPSRGLATFVRLAYNSKDTSDSPAGYGWSLQASAVMRLGVPLDPHPNKQGREVSLTDGDGTTHTFLLDANGEYVHPSGVHLYLQKLKPCGPKDEESRAWVMTKPDRTQFFFDCQGYVSAVVDNNGNEMSFTYEVRRSNNKPNKYLRYLTDPTGRQTLTIDYWAKGDAYSYIDDNDWLKKSGTNLTNPFIIDKVRQVTDISGRTLAFTYTPKGLLGELTDATKRFAFRYDMTQGNKNVKLVNLTDPRGNATNVSYYSTPEDDPKFKWSTKAITDRLGFPTSFAYTDPDGNNGQQVQTRVTDAQNRVTTYLMDGKGRPVQSTNAKNQVTKLGWDTDNNVVRLEEANAAVSTYSYDPKTGYPLEIKDAEANANGYAGTKLTYQTGLNGNIADLISKTSPEGRKWTFGYSAEGDPITVTDPLGTLSPAVGDFTATYTYDDWGQLLTAADANGNTTTFSDYHPCGYPGKITEPAPFNHPTLFSYDARGNVLDMTNVLGGKTSQTYDAFGRPLVNKVPKNTGAGEFIVTPAPGYDANDNIITKTAPELHVNGVRVGDPGAVSTAAYDKLDRVAQVLAPKHFGIDPERKTSFTYDKVGNLLTTTEPKGNLSSTVGDFVTTNSYDEIYQLTAVTNARGHRLSYEYDTVGNATKIVDPRKNATPDTTDYSAVLQFDRNHRMRTVIDPIGKTEVTEYDRDGLVKSRTDKAGLKTEMLNDARGKPVEVKVPHWYFGFAIVYHTTRFEYDQVGNRTKLITPRGVNTPNVTDDFVHQTVYDQLNRVSERLTPFSPSDATYNKPDKTTFTYDALGRLQTLSAPPSHNQTVRNDTRYTYYDNGWNKTATDPWGIVTTYDHNPLGQQTSNKLASAGGSSERVMLWEYFGDGAVKSRRDDGAPFGKHVVLADNSDFQNVRTTGVWNTASCTGTCEGFNYHAHAAASGTDVFEWTANVPQAGNYDVYVKYPAISGASTAATYKITHAGGSVDKPVDQTRNAGTWVNLGRYAFAEGNTGKVALSQSAGGAVAADSVKLVRDTTGEPADSEANNFSYRYDPNGNLMLITDASSGRRVDTYTVDYTEFNQVASVIERMGTTPTSTTTFGYNLNGALETTGHDRSFARYDYDVRDLVSRVTNGESASDPAPKVTTYTYTDKGERLREVKPNGNGVDFGYFLDGLLRTQIEKKADGTVVSQHNLEYDANGNRSRDDAKMLGADIPVSSLDTLSVYTYDPLDRVATVTKTGAGADTERYTHDANNNVISQTIKNVVTQFNYNRNRLATTVSGGVTASHNYDPFGRLDTVTSGSQTLQRKVYDGFDHVIEHRQGTNVTKYTFDPLDRTSSRTTDFGTAQQKTTDFNYLGLSNQVLDEQVASVIARSYQYSPWGERLSQTKHNTDGTEEAAYYGYNAHSDVEMLTAQTGAPKATYGYTAYGANDEAHFTGVDKPDTANPTKEPYNPYRFNAKRWDQGSSTYDMGFRDYSPGLNRFVTRDMYNGALADMNLGVNPFTMNRYAFGGGNPINRVEIDGHIPLECTTGEVKCERTDSGGWDIGAREWSHGIADGGVCPGDDGVAMSGTNIEVFKHACDDFPDDWQPVDPTSSFAHFLYELERIERNTDSNDEFVREAARLLAAFDAGRMPGAPGEGPTRGDDIEREVFGASGWQADIVDNDGGTPSPARHFIGFLAAGYFHPHTARVQLDEAESEGRDGASMQDRRSGDIAIDLGIDLRRGKISVRELIFMIEVRAGDPTNTNYWGNEPEEVTLDGPFICRIPMMC